MLAHEHSPSTRVLVVEDEKKVAQAICEGLDDEGYDVVIEHTGDAALSRINDETFAVVLLDLTLPGMDGLELLGALRRLGGDTRVLILTARDALDDRIVGLESGADDYLVKPFAFAELLARIRAVLRRGRPSDPPRLEVADLHMDLVTRRTTRAGRSIELTLREFELLEALLRSAGQVVSRETLARDVWRETSRSTTLDNVMDVHIARLRRKVDLGHSVKLIHTVRGVGFIVCEEEP
jgi:two-component system, OmpR family, copper resistance phosphate regulon response regulator CusR